MTWVADTSWLFALVDADDPHHVRALSEASEPSPVEVPDAIMAETLDLIRYRLGRTAAWDALEAFQKVPHFVLGGSAKVPAVGRVWLENKSLTFADASAVALALQRGYDLRSFDKRQKRAVRPDAE